MANMIDYDHNVVIYGIVEGPYHSSDIPEWNEDDCWILLCQVENSYGGFEVEELTFWTFDDAYEIVKHFKQNITPFIMEVDIVENDFPDFLKENT